MKSWWALSRFDTISITGCMVLIFWHDGLPQGPLDWTLNLGGMCLGWFSMTWLHYWWKTR